MGKLYQFIHVLRNLRLDHSKKFSRGQQGFIFLFNTLRTDASIVEYITENIRFAEMKIL